MATTAQLTGFISGCALDESDFSKKISDLGLDPDVFQQCVFTKMKKAGFNIKISDIPASSDTTLGEVLEALEEE